MFNSQAALQQGISHHRAGRLQQAEQIYQQILTHEPQNADALNLLGVIASQVGSYENAVNLITQAIQNNSKKSFYYNNLANALMQQGKTEEAINSYRRALEIHPNYAEAHNNLGAALKTQGKLSGAIASYCRALEINPDYVEAQANLGNVLNEKGQLAEATASYRRAIAINPGYAEAHRHLAMVKRHINYDDEIQAMEYLLEKVDLADEQKMHLYFGLGKAFEDLGEYEKSFNFLIQGNRIKRSTFSYSIAEHENYFKKIKSVFNEKLFGTFSGCGFDDSTPVFVVGMPRSGSTLIEQILSSHRQVQGAGEINALEDTILGFSQKRGGFKFPDNVLALDRDAIARLGAGYIKQLRRYSGSAKYITDKTLHNFFYIGMIKLILPNAKIIHCKRSPVDTCLSCFKTYFTGIHKFAYDLVELGKYYNLYQDLMAYWHVVLPDHIYDVHYEDIVADQKTATKQLLEFCGLDWDEACMSFYKSDRPVATASSAQVRRPVYSSSIRLWKKYAKQLEPLLIVLEQK